MRPEGAPEVPIRNPIAEFQELVVLETPSVPLQGNFHLLFDPGLKAWAIDV
jgi:hypothetical protein